MPPAPTHSTEVLVSDLNRAYVKQWVSNYAADRPTKVLLLVGPGGCGKSTLAELALRECIYQIEWINADTYRGKTKLQHRLKFITRQYYKQAILVEDPEALVTDGGWSVLTSFAKQGSRVPVIAICARNKRPKLTNNLSGCEIVEFRAMPTRILREHFGVEDIKNGDLRQLSMERSLQNISFCDVHTDMQNACRSVIAGDFQFNPSLIMDGDSRALSNMVHTNYLHPGTDISAIAEVAARMSDGDLVDGESDLGRQASFLVGAVSAGHFIRHPPSSWRPDVVWSKAAFANNRHRALHAAAWAFRAGNTQLDIHSMLLIHTKLIDQAQDAIEDIMKWVPAGGSHHIIFVLRLWSPPSAAVISRVRRALKKCEQS